MQQIFTILVSVLSLTWFNVNCIESSKECYENYLAQENFNYADHEVCNELFNKNLSAFQQILETIKDDEKSSMDGDKKCVFEWFQSEGIRRIFLRSLAKNEIQSDTSLKKSLNDLVKPSINQLAAIPNLLCDKETIYVRIAANAKTIKKDFAESIVHHEKTVKERCLLKNFFNAVVTPENSNILNYQVNVTGIDCNETSDVPKDDETLMNEIYAFDMSRKQIKECNEKGTLMSNAHDNNSIFDALLLVFEHYDVNETQEEELKRIFFKSVETSASESLKCMSEIK